MFPIVRVDQRPEAPEQLGSKPKFWFRDDGRRLLFKAEARGTGEDWAEKIACELCELLGLPHVHYELAEQYDGNVFVRPGVVCESCVPAKGVLVLGNELLLARDPQYPADERQKYKVREHTVEAVTTIIRELQPPADEWMQRVPRGIETALDVFVGYVLLDAWTANQDRHHENWAALQDAELRLAPTFDHGASLARNLSDEERDERLHTRDARRAVRYFAERAKSAFYPEPSATKPLGTVDALAVFAKSAVNAARIWRDELARVDEPVIRAILDQIPPKRLSGIASEFTLQLLRVNQERIQQIDFG